MLGNITSYAVYYDVPDFYEATLGTSTKILLFRRDVQSNVTGADDSRIPELLHFVIEKADAQRPDNLKTIAEVISAALHFKTGTFWQVMIGPKDQLVVESVSREMEVTYESPVDGLLYVAWLA